MNMLHAVIAGGIAGGLVRLFLEALMQLPNNPPKLRPDPPKLRPDTFRWRLANALLTVVNWPKENHFKIERPTDSEGAGSTLQRQRLHRERKPPAAPRQGFPY